MITASRLREVLHYDPESGVFIWRLAHGRYGMYPAGTIAGCIKQGYRLISIDGRGNCYFAHRLAWLYITEDWPKNEIDHINMDRADNRWCNLREATKAQNQANVIGWSNNTSGIRGVDWIQRTKKWRARAFREHLGYFATKEDARIAVYEASKKLHGEFAR